MLLLAYRGMRYNDGGIRYQLGRLRHYAGGIDQPDPIQIDIHTMNSVIKLSMRKSQNSFSNPRSRVESFIVLLGVMSIIVFQHLSEYFLVKNLFFVNFLLNNTLRPF